MPKRKRDRSEITYTAACDLLESALASGTRAEILAALESGGDFNDACDRLRSAMRSHIFPTSREPIVLHRIVQSFDSRARRAGLHVLEAWDYNAHRFADEILPVLMLDRCALRDVPLDRRRAALSVLLDHYFVSILGLVVARAWDEGDANENLERVNHLLDVLNAGAANGTRFVDDAETLLLVAVSHYHPEESAYDNLLLDVAELNDAHRLRLALACAAALGSHLRWGLRFMYRRDVGLMRDDNAVDYPWLVFSLVTLAREYLRMRATNAGEAERHPIVEGLLNGLTADPWFVTGKTPSGLRSHHAEHAELREFVVQYRDALMAEMEAHRPETKTYSPLGLSCNFLCNTVVAMVGTALAEPGPHPPLNALFTRQPRDGWEPDAVERHSRRLMSYARSNDATSDTAALIVYDPYEGVHCFNQTVAVLRDVTATSSAVPNAR